MLDYKSARRIIIYRIGSLGDTIVALPSLHLIARAFPAAHRVLLTNFSVSNKAPAASSILNDSGLIDDYMRYVVHTRNPAELAHLWWKIVRYRPDALIYLMPERPRKSIQRDALFFRSAGVRNIVGLPDTNEPFRILDAATGLFQTEASRLGRTISILGDAAPESLQNWDLRLTPAENKTAERAIAIFQNQPIIVCGPATKWPSKDWGSANWYALLQRLSASFPDHGLAFVGAQEDSPLSANLQTAWSGKTVNLCGQLTPRETAAVLSHADLFLGPDSGPMHLAALMSVPCVIAFSAQGKPGVWFPVGNNHRIIYNKIDCAGCGLEVCVQRQNECLRLISVDEMYAAAASSLRSPQPCSPHSAV